MLPAKGVRLNRGERYNQITHEMSNDSGIWHTVHTIAKLIGIKPSTHLRNMLNEMVEHGLLHRQYRWPENPTKFFGQRPQATYYCLPHRDPRKEMFG